jgi:hypothetical protein
MAIAGICFVVGALLIKEKRNVDITALASEANAVEPAVGATTN